LTSGFRRIGRYANYTDTFLFRAVNKRLQTLRISCRKDDSLNAALHELFESFGVPYAKRGHRAIYQFDTQLCDTTSFVQHAAPELIIEKRISRGMQTPMRTPVLETDKARAARFGV